MSISGNRANVKIKTEAPSDLEEGEIVESPVQQHSIKEEDTELEDGEVKAEDIDQESKSPQPPAAPISFTFSVGTEPKATSAHQLDSSLWNNENFRRFRSEDRRRDWLFRRQTRNIGKELEVFERFTGHDFSKEKNRHERIAKVMIGASDHIRDDPCFTSSEDENGRPKKTVRSAKKGSKLVQNVMDHRQSVRSAAAPYGIHLKETPLVMDCGDKEVVEPFTGKYFVTYCRLEPTDIHIEQHPKYPAFDPREKYQEAYDECMKRKRVPMNDVGEGLLFKKLDILDRKKRKVDFRKSTRFYRHNRTAVDHVEFGELLTESNPRPTPDQPVSLTMYKDLTPFDSGNHDDKVKIEFTEYKKEEEEEVKVGDVTEEGKKKLEALGVEVPGELDVELADEIIAVIGEMEDCTDLRKVHEMQCRLSTLFQIPKFFHNGLAVAFILRLIHALQGSNSLSKKKGVKRERTQIEKGSIVGLRVQPGPHHKKHVVADVKELVIDSLRRECFLHKEVGGLLDEMHNDDKMIAEEMQKVEKRYQQYKEQQGESNEADGGKVKHPKRWG